MLVWSPVPRVRSVPEVGVCRGAGGERRPLFTSGRWAYLFRALLPTEPLTSLGTVGCPDFLAVYS